MEWEFVKLSTSYLSTYIARLSLSFVTIYFAGTLSHNAHLDGVGLSSTLYNIFIMSVSQGYAYLFETYGPQVHKSSGELTTTLIKCLLQGVLVHLVILGPYLNLVYVIDMLPRNGLYPTMDTGGNVSDDQLDDFRDIAVQYLRYTAMFELLEYAVFMTSTYFAIQGKTKFVYIVSLVMAVAHFIANYIIVSVLEFGVEGLGIAGFIGRFFGFATSLLICILNVKSGQFPWEGISTKLLLGWKPMLKLGMCGAGFHFIDVSMFEISTFLSQFVNTSTLSTVIILLQVLFVLWGAMFAIALTASNLIGQALSEGNLLKIRQYMQLTWINTILALVPSTLIPYFLRGKLVSIFTDDPEVFDLFTSWFWLGLLGLVASSFHMTINFGVLTAFGQQRFAAFTTGISCYLVGLPIVISSIFLTDLGLTGIITGWIASDTIVLLATLVKISRTSIEKEVEKSQMRVIEANTTYGSLDTSDEKAAKTNFANIACVAEIEQVKSGEASGSKKQDSNEGENLIEDDPSSSTMDNIVGMNEEVWTVLGLFVVFGVLFATLAGISFLRT